MKTESGETIHILLSAKQNAQASLSIRAPENVRIIREKEGEQNG